MNALLSFNMTLFEKINQFAGHTPWADPLMVFGAQYAIFLGPLLLVVLWLYIAEWSPLKKWAAKRIPEDVFQYDRQLGAQILFYSAIAVVLAILFSMAIGRILYEPRPFISYPADHLLINHPADAAFPSDHESVISAVTFTLIYYLSLLAKPIVAVKTALADISLKQAAKLSGRFIIPALLVVCGVALMLYIGVSRVYVGVHYPGDIIGGALNGFVCSSLVIFLRSLLQKIINPFVSLASRLKLI